jgi:hypothetical protein
MPPAVKSWGPRRTGTNVFTRVLEEATDLETDVPGWKHGVPLEVPEAQAHLVHVKHPYAWLLSMERWWSFNETADRALVRMHARWDARDAVMRAHATRLDAYAGNVQGWLCRLPDEDRVLVRYEDVLADASEVVERVAEAAGAEIVNEPALPGQRVDSRGSKREASFDPAYYTERQWLDELHPDELAELDGYLEETGYRELFADVLGYEMDLD